MVRRSEFLKIKDDPTRSQITYCKRKKTLLRKCKEISDLCEIDLAFIAFSPTGRVDPYSSRLKMEDVIQRYLDLPPDKRYFYLDCVQVEKLEQLNHILGDENKLSYLNNQIKHLELEIQKATLEREIVNNKLGFYELGQDEEPTISELTWVERNLKASLELVRERKNQVSNEYNFHIQNAAGMTQISRNLSTTQHGVPHDRLSQYRVRGGENEYQDLRGLVNQTLAGTLNGYVDNLPVTSTFPSGGHLGLNSSLILGTGQFLPSNSSSVQKQPMIEDQDTHGTPTQLLEGKLIGNSSVGNMVRGAPIWVQNHQTPQTWSYNWNNLKSQNMAAPTSQFQVTTMGCSNMPQNPNVNNATLPLMSNSGTLFSRGYTPITPNGFTIANNTNYPIVANNGSYEEQFTNNTAVAATVVTIYNNGHYELVPNQVPSTTAATVTAIYTTAVDAAIISNEIGGNNNGSFEPFPSQVCQLLENCSFDEILEHCSLDEILEDCSLDEILSELNLPDDQNNLSNENMVAPAFRFQVNPNEVFNGADNNATQNPNVNNVTLPLGSNLGILPNDYGLEDPTFTTTNSMTNVAWITSNNDTSDNGGFEPYHSQVNLPLTGYTIPSDHNLSDNQVGSDGILEGEFQWLEHFDFKELASFLD